MNWYFAAGDAPFFFSEQLKKITFFPSLWHFDRGFGVSALPSLWIDYPFYFFTHLLSTIGLSWFVLDKLWWILACCLAIAGSYRLARFLGTNQKFSLIGCLLYSTNTYCLLLFDGGQLGVALAYGIFPLALLSVLSYFTVKKKSNEMKQTILTGLACSLLFIDLRVVYMFCLLLLPFFMVLLWKKKLCIPKLTILIPIIILAINAFWIVPTVQYRNSVSSFASGKIGEAVDLKFFSVADFPDSVSLLHPNYPENLFGRVYFLKPEFLIIPILAFSLFLFSNNSLLMLVMGFIGLLGAFLSKGVNDPFGGTYGYLYKMLPGFFLFRDPTKWYFLTALSYSLLIPQTLARLSEKIKHRGGINAVLLIFILFWIVSLRLVFLGKVTGNVHPPLLTADYEALKNVLMTDPTEGRTLWLPVVERFGYGDERHPFLDASILAESSPSGIERQLESVHTIDTIRNAGISYVIVPEDVSKRIFLDDYVYKESIRSSLVAALDGNQFLHKIPGFSRLVVYKLDNPQPFFQVNNTMVQVEFLPEDTIKITLPAAIGTRVLEVSMTYDPNWQLKGSTISLKPQKTPDGLMEFTIPAGNAEQELLTYRPTASARTGAFVSFVALFFSILGLVIVKEKK